MVASSGPSVLGRRRNGFSRPYTAAQVGAWLALFFTFAHILIFITPILPLIASIVVTAVFAFVILGACFYGAKAQATDPIDGRLAAHFKNRPEEGYYRNAPTPMERMFAAPIEPRILHDDAELKQCWICDTQVHEKTIHCRFCSKCVFEFDHHCMWLNTCVGKANYDAFFRTMMFVLTLEVMHCCICIILVIEYFAKNDVRFRNWFNADLPILVVIVMLFFALFSAVSIILVGQLVLFHINLQKERISTYEFIIRDSKRRRELASREDELRNKRIMALAAARQQGRTFRVYSLRIGGICRALNCPVCDPLVLPEPRGEKEMEMGPVPGDAEAEEDEGDSMNPGDGIYNDHSTTCAPMLDDSTAPVPLDKPEPAFDPIDEDNENVERGDPPTINDPESIT